MPVKHGAPMIEPMLAIHRAAKHELIQNVACIKADFWHDTRQPKHYFRHDWQGTVKATGSYHLEEWQDVVKRTGGYHLEEWQRIVMQKQLAVPTDQPTGYNHDLLSLIPPDARGVVEVGCHNGTLARVYKGINPSCVYTGIEIDEANAELARRYCDTVLLMDIEKVDESFYGIYSNCNVWIFGDVLEHLRNPWEVLARIRRSMPADGCVVVCLPNAQHWSVQAKLCVGDFRYEDSGLMDRTHLRFFTRATMLEMFAGAGFKIETGFPRIFGEINNEHVIGAIKMMAKGVGADPEMALQDSLPLQYVVKLIPG
jgi:SAM-dependent methyltransferase